MSTIYLSDATRKRLSETAYGGKNKEDEAASYLGAMTATYEQPKEQQGVIGDTIDAFEMGLGRGASDLSRLVAIGANKLGFDSVESWFNKAADASAQYADEQMNEMSDEMKAALKQDVTDDPTALMNIRWWAGNLGAVLGSELDTVLVTIGTFGAGSAAYAGTKTAAKQGLKQVFKKELANKVGEVAVNEALKRGASKQLARVAGVTAVQSAMMAGSRANQIRDEMLNLSDDELANNEQFQQVYNDLYNTEEGMGLSIDERFEVAKNNFIAKAAREAAFNPVSVLSDLATNAVSGLGGGFMGVGKASKNVVDGLKKGALKESVTEAIQEVTDQYSVNTTAKDYYDPNRDVTEGMASNAIQGAILGAAFGAPTGALDVYNDRRVLNKAKKEFLKFKSTGNETVDESLRSYVDMVNSQANDLEDLISQSRFNAHYVIAQKEARAANIMAQDASQANLGTNEVEIQNTSPAEDDVVDVNNDQSSNQEDVIDQNNIAATQDTPTENTVSFLTDNDLSKLFTHNAKLANKIADLQDRLEDPTISDVDKQGLQAELNSHINETKDFFNPPFSFEKTQLDDIAKVNPQLAKDLTATQSIITNKLAHPRIKKAAEQQFSTLLDQVKQGNFVKFNDLQRKQLEQRQQEINKQITPDQNPKLSNDEQIDFVEQQLYDDQFTPEQHIEPYSEVRFSRSQHNTLTEQAYNQAKAEGRTELDFNQWKQVRTPEFKAWFGDWENDPKNASKVINPRTGEPLVVYHGSNNYEETRKWNDKQKYYETEYQPFNIFKRNVDGLENQGHFFNSDKDNAFGYGVNEYHTYLNLKNPLIIDAKSSHYSAIKHKRNIKDTYDWAKYAENKGYDGVIFENVRDGADFSALDNDTNNFVAFASNQIKSATDNIGTFDPNNNDIRYSRKGNVNRPKSESLEKLRNAESIHISGNDIEPSADLKQYKRNALNYGKLLRGSYINKDTGQEITLGRAGVQEVLRHDYKDPDHLQSIAAIPQIIENAIYIDTLPNEDRRKHPDIESYDYYAVGLNIGGDYYTVKAVIANSTTGEKYYDHKLSEIEKGDLLEMTSRVSTAEISNSSPLSRIEDKRLLQLLQAETADSTENNNAPHDKQQLQSLLSNILTPEQSANVEIVTGQTAPDNARKFIRDGVEGWFNPKTGKVTLVPSNIRATKNMSREMRLAWVAWHELGHLGVNVKYRADYKGIMEKARKHSVVGAMSEAIMADRKRFVDKSGKYTDPAATNKDIATEEALVELLAAHETGNFDELRQRYGVKINTLHEKNFKAWFKIIADKVRQLMNKLFGRSFDEMTDYDLIRLIGGIKQGINSNPTPPTTGKRFSLNEHPDSDFARAVDDVASGKFTAQQVIDVGTTPAVLKMLGLPDVNVVINGSVLKKVMLDKHNVRPEVLKQLPRQINNPVAVMKSSTQQNGYVVLTELTENVNGVDKPIIAALHLKQSKQGLELINIASVYGRNISQLQNGLNNDLLYWNKTKGSQLARRVGLQLPSSLTSAENLSVGSGDNLTLQLRSPLSKNQPLSNIKTEEDLKQYLPEIKFSAATSVLDSAFNKLGYGEKESALERGVSEFKQAKSRTVSEWKALATDWGRKMNTWVFDSLAPIKYWEDKAGVTDHSQSGYTAARLAAGSGSIAEASMTHGLPEWKDGIIQRKAGTSKNDALLGIMENLGDDMNNFLAWIAGNRAEKLMAEGREHNLSVEEIQELKALNKGKEQKFEQARKKLMNWNKAILDLAEHAGLFTKEDRAKWEDTEWYIPFYRETEEGDVIAPFRNKGLANQTAGIKRLKGSDKATSDLLSNIITNATKLIDASVKNDALTKAVVNLADTDVITVIEKPNLIDYRRLEQNKQGKGIKDGGLAIVKIKGEDYMIEVHDKALFNAITSIDQKPLDYTGRKIFTGAKHVLTATVTSMPDFIVRNFLRDVVQAATTDRNHMKLGVDSLKGLKESYSKGGAAVDLMFSGASFGHGYIDAGDPKVAADNIRKHLRKKGYSKSEIDGYMKTIVWSKDQLTNLLDKYQHLNSSVENANRVAVYHAALKNGKSKAQAALEAKDLMDFSMKGNARIIRFLADILPFFNARLQGLSQLGRAFKDNPKKVAQRGAMIALTSVGLALANMGNDRYEELPDEEKDNYWHIFIGNEHLRIPKPFELGVAFGTIPERLLRTTLGLDSTGKLGERLSSAVINTLSLNPIPQVAKPLAELYMNKDMFSGREIESMSDKRLISAARYDENTSLLARGIGQVTGEFGLSPKQIEHLARGYFGTLGMYVLGMSDYLIRANGNYGDKPKKNWNELPVFSALFGGDVNVPRRYTSYMNDYYEYLNKATEIVATINNYEKKRGMLDEARQLKEENKALLRHVPLLNKVQKELKGVKNEIDLIQRDRVMSAERKRQRIDQLLARRNQLVKMVAERVRQEDY
ncbi:LPD38 domain-containing protein [Gallibacterium salpingitidis]|uniref:LPD38 domain-containing protein n=1 Tax=Gallibacterium salpingitidis TaxID=505341 RepID=UPI000824E0D5|nr:LPD38 domain-containing protein [Gallibacterium salpingitidis]